MKRVRVYPQTRPSWGFMYQNGEYGRFLALYLFHRTVIIGARSHGEPEVS